MLAKTDLIWADLDIIALRPLDFDSEYVFGYETPELINSAVLRLPKDSLALAALLKITPTTRGLPLHISGRRRAEYWLKRMGRGLPITSWPWGSTGPLLLTKVLQQTGEASHALPINAFYPVPPGDAHRFADPNGFSTSELSSETYCVHLWGKFIRSILNSKYEGRIAHGSYLHELSDIFDVLPSEAYS